MKRHDNGRKKQYLRDNVNRLNEEIEILKSNVAEFESILDKIQTEEDLKKYKDFDIEKGLNIIALF